MLAAMEPRLRAALLALAALLPTAAAAGKLPAGFVYLRDIDPSIAQEMRYAGPDNFTGRPLPGYRAAECVLRREAAQALARVQADLAGIAHDPEKWEPVFGKDHAPGESLGLKVYDCYRPTRAVAGMARWARQAESPDAPTKRFYPALDRRALFALGYIAAHSAHSTGVAVDLTLIARDGKENTKPAAFDPRAPYGRCTAPLAQRAPDNSLDMGTGFDCFDEKSRTLSPAISAEQKSRRAHSSPRCASAAGTIISANGGTSPSARARRAVTIFRSLRADRGDAPRHPRFPSPLAGEGARAEAKPSEGG